jgi:LysM repeat protein
VKRFGESQLKSWNFHVANIYLAIYVNIKLKQNVWPIH